MRRRASIPAALALALIVAGTAFAQNAIQVTGQVGGAAPITILEGGTLAMSASGVGRNVLAVIRAVNSSASPLTLTRIGFNSSSEYAVLSSPTLPASVPVAGEFSILVQFTAASGLRSIAHVSFDYTQGSTTSSFLFNVSGAAPEFAFNYYLAPSGPLTPVSPGGKLLFPPSTPGTLKTIVLIVSNRGSGPGTLASWSASGPAFQVAGLTTPPVTLNSGEEYRFSIFYAPQTIGPSQGLLTINFSDRGAQFGLEGSGSNPDFVISYTLPDGTTNQIAASGTISFPPINAGATAQAVVTILNKGTGPGTVSYVFLSGNGFQLTNLPLLPATLEAGGQIRFAVQFSPRQSGGYSGALQISMGNTTLAIVLEGATAPPKFTTYYVLSDGNARPLVEGDRLTFLPTPVSTTAQADIVVANEGTGSGQITGISLTGATFELSGVPVFPFLVEAGQAFRFRVRFSPLQAGTFTGTLRIELTNRTIIALVEGSTSAPDISVNYVEPDTNNVLPLSDNGTLSFPATPVDSRTTVTVVLINRGRGSGSLTGISVIGGDAAVFQLIERPPLPVTIAASELLRFGVRFSPLKQQTYFSALRIEFADRTITVGLQGAGTGPAYIYELLQNDASTGVIPGSVLNLPDAAVGQTATITLQVRNIGPADGQILTIMVTGQAFQLVDAPVLPVVLKTEQSQRIRIAFVPREPGVFNGRVRIGADAFELEGKGIGSRLIYSFTNAAATSPVIEGGVVVFAPAAVGERSSVEFSVQNTGTSAAAIASISLVAPSSIYRLERLPVLPMNLEPEQRISFGILFVPNNTGTLTAGLRINNSAFTLAGSGNQPVTLPPYRFDGAAGTQEPLQQPAIGLTLAAPYPLSLQGSLTMTFVSDVFSTNPAVQFATGGRKVNFTIPPNTTQALFENNASTVRVQTGTVAGNIVLTPAFVTEAGLDLTPSSPPALTLTIARSAPKLIEVKIASRSLTSFSLAVTGYATTRTLRQMDVRLTARTGKELTTTQLTVNLEGPSLLWYQSADSQAYGGLFMIAIPIQLQGGNSGEDLVGRIQTAEVTARNEVGTSNAVTVPLP